MSNGTSSDGERAADARGPTRRGFLAAVGGAAVAAGASREATAQAETYRFGGEVQAWRGQAPTAIEGEDNPTLQLEAGTDYEVVWENLDGQPHDFVIQDASGNEIVGTDTISEEGETATLSFTATAEMDQYICTIHPTTMVGSVQIVGEGAGGAEEDTGLPVGLLLVAGAFVAAVLSPLAFALFLFRNRGGEERPAPRPGD